MTRRISPRSAAAGSVLLLTVALAACTPGGSSGTPTPVNSATSVASGSASASASEDEPAAPAFLPDGDAEANLPIFSAVVNEVWASDARAQGRAYIDALVAAGFSDKSAMQVTPDQTTIGQAAESIQFSVRWQGNCLLGQVGPATGEPVTAVQAVLPGDVCLIGSTRPIDW